MTMQRLAAVLAALATATLVAGCGGHGDRDQVWIDANAGQFNVMTRGDALPEGHPPVGGYHRSLPEGHPPVAGYGDGLPPGHPVCPAGRQQLEPGGGNSAGSDDPGPQLIST
jgi:hypothetical protein